MRCLKRSPCLHALTGQGQDDKPVVSPRKATMARRPCLSSASFSLKVRAESSPEARLKGSK